MHLYNLTLHKASAVQRVIYGTTSLGSMTG